MPEIKEKACLECGDKIIGRADKKFCSDQCRISYNNKLNSDETNYVRNVNNILRKNRRILIELNTTGKQVVPQDKLKHKGFDFNYFTSTYTTKDGAVYKFCYEQGYREVERNSFFVSSQKRLIMSYWEALYGSQYWELASQGKDGNKGRLNANLFLSAFIILTWLNVIMLSFLIPGFESSVNQSLANIFGGMSGKAIGQLITIPLLWIIYKIVSSTIGSQENFKVHVDGFLKQPEEEKKKAFRQLIIPFLAQVLLLLLGTII